ncbi:unnamed protein product, partial [Prorocentrum cordatum]
AAMSAVPPLGKDRGLGWGGSSLYNSRATAAPQTFAWGAEPQQSMLMRRVLLPSRAAEVSAPRRALRNRRPGAGPSAACAAQCGGAAAAPKAPRKRRQGRSVPGSCPRRRAGRPPPGGEPARRRAAGAAGPRAFHTTVDCDKHLGMLSSTFRTCALASANELIRLFSPHRQASSLRSAGRQHQHKSLIFWYWPPSFELEPTA